MANRLAEIRKAIEIAEKTFASLEIIPGMTEREVASQICSLLKEYGAKKESFKTIVASGKRSGMIHGFASDKVIKKGEVVMLDFGALYKEHRSDLTRTYVLGQPDAKQKMIWALLLRAQKAAIEAVKDGASSRLVDHSARDIIEKAGYGKLFKHSTGHGVGRMIHESPRIRRTARTRLKAGMVITIEPGIYFKDWGMRVEDMVLVTKTGCQLLTHVPRSLKLK